MEDLIRKVVPAEINSMNIDIEEFISSYIMKESVN